jgi:hypothetical protein
MDRFTEPVTKSYCYSKDWTLLHNCNFVLFQTKQFFGFICRLPLCTDFLGQSILKDSRDMLLNTCQYHLMFLVEEHIVIALASLARNLLLKICLPDNVLSIWKALKHWKPDCFNTSRYWMPRNVNICTRNLDANKQR